MCEMYSCRNYMVGGEPRAQPLCNDTDHRSATRYSLAPRAMPSYELAASFLILLLLRKHNH
eukprot:4560349-Pleurochrysis_carterae.AAC.1